MKEYEAERRREAAEKRRNRATLDRELEEAKTAITRIVERLAKGLIEDDDAAAILPGLRADRDRLQRELETVEPPSNVIELQPRSVRAFRENIERLAEVISKRCETPPVELAQSFREMIAGVIVEPRKAGEPYRIEIKGYVSGLVSPELSSVLMVAEEGFEPPTQGL